MSIILKIKSFAWNKKYVLLFVFLFLILFTQRFINSNRNGLQDTIVSDGMGYYSYLPAAIIYQDFKYDFYQNPDNHIKLQFHTYFDDYNGKKLNRYYCGTAICLLPFFLLGIVISAVAGTDINGYTDTFLMLVSLASIFYFVFSTYLMSKIASYFSVPEKYSFWLCVVFFLGTNLFHYVIQEPSMSHVYSFFAVTLAFYFVIRLIRSCTNTNLLYLSLSISLIVLIRPVNVVFLLFIPFFFENFKAFLTFLKGIFKNNKIGLLLSIIVFILAVFLQLFLYYLQTGKFIVETYQNESFNFTKPEFFLSFFSYRKGLFIYTPLFLVALLFILFRQGYVYKKIIFFLTFLLFTYITVSWWCWYYGGGFSIRPFIDILPLFIIIALLLFTTLSSGKKKIVLVSILPFLFFNQLKCYQYANGLIHTYDMNEEMYWDVFYDIDLGRINSNKMKKLVAEHGILKTDSLTFENYPDDPMMANEGHNSSKSTKISQTFNFSKTFDTSFKDLNIKSPVYIVAECDIKDVKNLSNSTLVISVVNNHNIIKWEASYRNQFKPGKDGWIKMSKIAVINNDLINDENTLSILAQTTSGEGLVDNFKYTIIKK